MKISPARAAAFDVLMRIETEKAFSSALLPHYEDALSAADASLCHEITLGSLRRQIYLDRVIDFFAGGKKLDIAVRVALRIGLYQLIFLDKIPAYSAINESVELVRRAKKTSAKSLVNAVLRRATSDKAVLNFVDEIERISVETSHPRWLIEKWIAEFGASETESLAAANNEIPKTVFRLTATSREISTLLSNSCQKSEFVDGCYIAIGMDKNLRDLEREGAIYFQDEASQMVAHSVAIPESGSFLDVCAAPGGKTGLIAKSYETNIKLAVAGDLHLTRAKYLKNNCSRQKAEFVNVMQFDAVNPLPFADETFDVVLVDAPCSGTGTIRHNPEIRYSLTPDDFAELSVKQLNILTNASKVVKRGGSIIYSTCSLEKEENESVAQQFLAANPTFGQAVPNLPERFLTRDGFARTWPHRDNMDGFFVAGFRRS